MGVIADTRAYFNTKISQCNSDLREWRDAFNKDNIPNTLTNRYYHIQMGDNSTSLIDKTFLDELDVTVTFFSAPSRDTVDLLDTLYEEALKLRLNASDVTNYNGTYIKRVVCNSMSPSFFDDNDNLHKIELQFTVTLAYRAY